MENERKVIENEWKEILTKLKEVNHPKSNDFENLFKEVMKCFE